VCQKVMACRSFVKRILHCTAISGIKTGEENVDNLLSVEEAAKRLGGISRWTVHSWLSKGKLQRTKVGGRTMTRESELAKVIEDGGKSPAPRRKDGPRW